jgi:hypothetical protein
MTRHDFIKAIEEEMARRKRKPTRHEYERVQKFMEVFEKLYKPGCLIKLADGSIYSLLRCDGVVFETVLGRRITQDELLDEHSHCFTFEVPVPGLDYEEAS